MSDIPQPNQFNRKPIVAAILGGIVAVSSTQMLMAGTNPPAVKNPTLMLAATCNPCNPCQRMQLHIKRSLFRRNTSLGANDRPHQQSSLPV